MLKLPKYQQMKNRAFSISLMMRVLLGFSLLLSTYLALMPSIDMLNIFNIWDKFQHALGFIALTVIASLAYPNKTKLIYIALILYGAFIEIAQHAFTTTRLGEVSDLWADIIGVALGACIYVICLNIIKYINTNKSIV